jgi:hypothetical protein
MSRRASVVSRILTPLVLPVGAACGLAPVAGPAPQAATIVSPSGSTVPERAPAREPPALGQVVVGLFDERNEADARSVYDRDDEIAALVSPCYATARGGDPSLVGWVLAEVKLAYSGPSPVRVLDHSPLPDSLVGCIAGRLAAVAARDTDSPGMARRVYVSLR